MVNVSVRYITDYTDDQAMLTIDSQTTLDARYSYMFSGAGSSEYTLTLGAVNIFNEDPRRSMIVRSLITKFMIPVDVKSTLAEKCLLI